MTEHKPYCPAQNPLPAALPAHLYERLQPYWESLLLALGKVICEAQDVLSRVRFPASAIVSLLCTIEDCSSVKMGVVGRDGVVGIAVFTGGDTTPDRAVVQSVGDAFGLELKPFRAEFRRSRELHRLLLLCIQVLLTRNRSVPPLTSPQGRGDVRGVKWAGGLNLS